MFSMRHIALRVRDMARSRHFYENLLGLKVVWEPDPDNVYLSSGDDNIALHQIPAAELSKYEDRGQRLDHLGFVVSTKAEVDRLAGELRARGVVFHQQPKDHRDGSRSFYIQDPDANIIQIIYLPGVSK